MSVSSDTQALTRLTERPEWPVFTRLLSEYLAMRTEALYQLDLDPIRRESLRAELRALRWVQHPQAVQDAVVDRGNAHASHAQ
jgi:hypothetical protein